MMEFWRYVMQCGGGGARRVDHGPSRPMSRLTLLRIMLEAQSEYKHQVVAL